MMLDLSLELLRGGPKSKKPGGDFRLLGFRRELLNSCGFEYTDNCCLSCSTTCLYSVTCRCRLLLACSNCSMAAASAGLRFFGI